MREKTLRIFAALLCMACLNPSYAQSFNATIKGTVVDAQGGVLPKADVEVSNIATGERRKTQVSPVGVYIFSALPPGNYAVKVTSTGFADWSGQLTLRVAQEAVIDVMMQTATVQTTVEVADVTPVISPETSSLADVKEASRIETLPLQTRSFLGILNFTPGVVANSFAGQGQGYTRVNGIPGGSIEFLVDGATASERYTNELQRLPQSLPTIQEIRVNTANTNAEYSRPGVVEVVTKSGSNSFHGQIFELNQNNHFAANSFHQQTVSFLTRNEYGFNLGGPVLLPKIYNGRNKTFFFFDYEQIRQRSAASQNFYTVPDAAWKAGDFATFKDATGVPITIYDPLSTAKDPATGSYTRTPYVGNKLPSSALSPIGQKIASYLPDPNINTKWYDGPNWQDPNGKLTDDRSMLTAKVDQLLGNNRLSGRYTYTDQSQVAPRYFLNPNVRSYGGHNASLAFTQLLNPTMVNEIRGGVQRFHAYRGPVPITPAITETLGLPTYPGTIAWPGIYFVDYSSSWLTNYFDGIDRDNPQDAPGLTLTVADNFSWNRPKHEMKFGFIYQRSIVNTFETGQPGGDYSFSGGFTALMDPATVANGIDGSAPRANTGAGLADMLMGYTDYAGLNTYPRFYTRQSDFAVYAQDNWKVSRKLTINVGLRYEVWSPFQDKRNQATTLNLGASGSPTVVFAGDGDITSQGFPAGVVAAYTAAGMKFQSASSAGAPSSLWKMQKNNLAPRIGAAYQLSPKTVLRGAYGIYYWVMPLVQYHQQTRKNAPFSYSAQSVVDTNFPGGYGIVPPELTWPVGPSNYANQALGSRTLGQDFLKPSALSVCQCGGWNIAPWDTNYKTQMAQEWNFTIERELPGRFGSRASYVGTHGGNLVQFDPINALVPRALAPGASVAQRRAYPDFNTSSTSTMDLLRTNGYSNSHQLQTEVKRNFSNGFVLQGFYTFQKTLTTSEGSNGAFSALEMLPAALTNNASSDQRLRLIYGNDSGLPKHNISFNANYELPFGHGKPLLDHANGLVNRLVSGWNVGAFYYWRSGLFFSPYYSARGSNTYLAPGKNAILPADQRQAARWFDSSVCRADIGEACAGQSWIRRTSLDSDFLNNVPRNYMTGPGFYNIDASFYKITPITERLKLRIEGQVFNLLNHKNFNLPNLTSGVVTSGLGSARLAQFQAKLEF
ncbi:TonB-dependent receptor [uncultured Paludibaculum sp.]|uniref:TonB-dependent receptor n=1 Tax=uncultured Paludibaculum sp. TaxID=1765020 RepID=UPI002AABAE7A|nr:TonB-dependent receptor [uncultured Paludibaculum sp.]